MSKEIFTYDSFVVDEPVIVVGADFRAMQYGKRYSENLNDGNRKIVISGEQRSYAGNVPEDKFPFEAELELREPHAPMREASHAGRAETIRVHETTLDEFVELLEERGMKFSDRP